MRAISSKPISYGLFAPDELSSDGLSDYELGGQTLNSHEGLVAQPWTFRYISPIISVSDPNGNSVDIATVAKLSDLAGAFDKDMNPIIAYTLGSDVFVKWGSNSITISNAKSPRLTFDNKNLFYYLTDSNVYLFYLRGRNLLYRALSDSFASEHLFSILPSGIKSIKNVGMNYGNRLQLNFITETTHGLGCDSGDWIIDPPGDPSTWNPGTINQFTWINPELTANWIRGQCPPDQWQRFPCGYLSGQTLAPWDPLDPIEPTLPCPEK